MKLLLLVLTALTVSFSAVSKDRLEIYEDYDVGSDVISMTTVKVDPNMGDVYLAGLQQSWVKALKIQKSLGYIKDWKIYTSQMPISGEFNMVLMIVFEGLEELEPNKQKYQAFMDKWGEENEEMSNAISAEYPKVRKLTGEYMLREIVFK